MNATAIDNKSMYAPLHGASITTGEYHVTMKNSASELSTIIVASEKNEAY